MSFLAGAKASLVFRVFGNDFMLDPLGECQGSSPMMSISEVGTRTNKSQVFGFRFQVDLFQQQWPVENTKGRFGRLESSEKTHQPSLWAQATVCASNSLATYL